MQRTLIAVFDNRGDAQSAIDALATAGFSRQQMRLSEGDPTGAPTTPDTSHGTGLVDSIRHFLGGMFGTDDSEYVQKYSDAVTRGHHVLTLTAADEPEVERAADIVERFGPVDIDEKTAQWSGGALAGEAMRGGAGAQQQSASTAQQSSAATPGSAQGMTAAGSMQDAAGQGSQQLFATGAAGASPVPPRRPGVRVFEHEDEAGLDMEADTAEEVEQYYRQHYEANLAASGDQYDAYEPAYRYGYDMASTETYRGRPWKDVEPALRTEWEGRNPGSTWEKIKAAVRHGWEKITT